MQIPAFKKVADGNNLAADIPVLKPLPMLVAVHINHSRFGVLLYRCSYSVFAASLLLVLYPFIVEQLLWLLALTLCWCGLWWAYCQQCKRDLTGALSFSGSHWLFEQEGRTCQLELTGEVLCWSWLIILPLRELASGKTRRILLFGDALNSADNTSLRRWLRACLVPTA